MTRLQKYLRFGVHHGQGGPVDGIRDGMTLSLPEGDIVAEQGVRHVSDAGPARLVVPVLHEAYVVVRLGEHRQCYATWLPQSGGWDLLCLDDEGAEDGEQSPSQTAASVASLCA
ncbi:MAG: hypothetical protein P4L83_22325 [Nevskia sp.]|nr:hypothetical protein [Nevskia sp.]